MVASRIPNPLVRVRVLVGVQIGIIAQLVEQWSEEPRVLSSNLSNTTNWNIAQWLEQDPYTVKVMGSNPVIPTNDCLTLNHQLW